MSRAGNSVWRLGASQEVAYTGTAGTSSAMGAQTYAVSITTTTDAYVSLTGTATSGDHFIPADTPLVVQCTPGQTVSAIQVSTGGNLHITELTH